MHIEFDLPDVSDVHTLAGLNSLLARPFSEMCIETRLAVMALHQLGKVNVYVQNDIETILPYPLWQSSRVYQVKAVAHKPDSIDWSHVHSKYHYMARDQDGETYLYTRPPYLSAISDDQWTVPGLGHLVNASNFASFKPGPRHWQDSLVTRPHDA